MSAVSIYSSQILVPRERSGQEDFSEAPSSTRARHVWSKGVVEGSESASTISWARSSRLKWRCCDPRRYVVRTLSAAGRSRGTRLTWVGRGPPGHWGSANLLAGAPDRARGIERRGAEPQISRSRSGEACRRPLRRARRSGPRCFTHSNRDATVARSRAMPSRGTFQSLWDLGV